MELTMNDLQDYMEDLKNAGFDNEEKLQGMVDRANEMAKEQVPNASEGEYKKAVVGILQSFVKKNQSPKTESVSEAFLSKYF